MCVSIVVFCSLFLFIPRVCWIGGESLVCDERTLKRCFEFILAGEPLTPRFPGASQAQNSWPFLPKVPTGSRFRRQMTLQCGRGGRGRSFGDQGASPLVGRFRWPDAARWLAGSPRYARNGWEEELPDRSFTSQKGRDAVAVKGRRLSPALALISDVMIVD